MSKELHRDALDFIDKIPDDKLLGGFPGSKKTIHKDLNYRFDMQTVTTGPPKEWNLQIQCNNYDKKKGGRKSSANVAPTMATRRGGSIALVLVPCDDPWSPSKIKQELRKEVNAFFG